MVAKAKASELLRAGLACYQAGRLAQAAYYYRQVLDLQPRNPDALHLSGLVAWQKGEAAEAERLFRAAIAANSRIGPYYNNLGLLLTSLGRYAEAAEAFQQAIRLAPRDPEARLNLAQLKQQNGELAAALQLYQEAIALDPRRPETYNNLGNLLAAQGRLEEAARALETALELRPQYAEARLNLAALHKRAGRLEQAEQQCRQAIQLAPALAAAYVNLTAILLAQGRSQEARAACRKALELDPQSLEANCNWASILLEERQFVAAETLCRQLLARWPQHAETWNNLGSALQEQGRLEEAESCYRQALALAPDYPAAQLNLANAYAARRRLKEAEQCYRSILERHPDHVGAHFHLGLTLLLSGRWKEGWPEYEWRWRRPEFFRRQFTQPLWDGRPLGGSAVVLVHAEQGLGDTVQFVRYLPWVKERSQARVVFECQPALVNLLQHFPGADQVIPAGAPLGAFDCHIPLLSLPRVFAAEPHTVPLAGGYLRLPPALTEFWRTQLDAIGRPAIGLVWAGNPRYPSDHLRSIAPHRLAPLLSLAGVHWIDLRYQGEPLAPLHQPLRGNAQLVDAAALITALDLLISVDTLFAHLAGALGAPVWTLLRYVPDWRWGCQADATPWYHSMRLWRQRAPDDWEEVLERVAGEIKNSFKSLTRSPIRACEGVYSGRS